MDTVYGYGGYLMKFIKAECTGNWRFYLKIVSAMLPYLAAAGHYMSNLFTLQEMPSLQTDHPNIQRHFDVGLHCV